jgi:putative sugar O-methyltransferase
MKQYKFSIHRDHAHRLNEYLTSPLNEFSYLRDRNHGPGWRRISIRGNQVFVTDQSGLDLDTNYIKNVSAVLVKEKTLDTRLLSYLSNAVEELKSIAYWFFECARLGRPKGLRKYKEHYRKIWGQRNGVDLETIEKRHSQLHYEQLLAYNYFNEVSPYIKKLINTHKLSELRVIEIGPGVGNLALVFANHQLSCPNKYFLIDLPEALPFSISRLMHQFPECRYVLPHEFDRGLDPPNSGTTFVFLTPAQAGLLESDYFDVGINTNSFAEMPSNAVLGYFKLLRRTLKFSNVSLIVNRVEKAMDLRSHESVDAQQASEKIYGQGDKNYQINRFTDYPWSDADTIYSYYVSSFNMCRTTQNFFLKILQMAQSSDVNGN